MENLISFSQNQTCLKIKPKLILWIITIDKFFINLNKMTFTSIANMLLTLQQQFALRKKLNSTRTMLIRLTNANKCRFRKKQHRFAFQSNQDKSSSILSKFQTSCMLIAEFAELTIKTIKNTSKQRTTLLAQRVN